MVLITPPNPHSDIVALGTYHAYRNPDGSRNAAFDAFSGKILDVKQEKQNAISHFISLLHPLFQQNIAIAVVPSHDPAKTTSGMKTIAKALLTGTNRIDATECLQRTTKVDKLASGGNRNIQVHLNSIIVKDVHLIVNQHVLLLDDVTTTTNSLEACRDLLLQNGAASVQGYALGRT